MAFTIRVICEKCDEEFGYVKIGIGSTHPVCQCSECLRVLHPRKKLFRFGWFCRHCDSKVRKENAVDLYTTPIHTIKCPCPNRCGNNLLFEDYMHSLYSLKGIIIHRLVSRILHYF